MPNRARTLSSAALWLALLGFAEVYGTPPVAAQKAFVAPPSLAPLADRLSDSVVNISTTQAQKGPQGVPLPKVPKGSPFEEFFDDFFQKRGGMSANDLAFQFRQTVEIVHHQGSAHIPTHL